MKEFPFLRGHSVFRGERVLDMRVARVDSQLLSMKMGSCGLADYPDLPDVRYDEIFLFDRDGQELGRVGHGFLRYRNPNHRWWKFSKEPKWLAEAPSSDAKTKSYTDYSETVGGAIKRLGVAEKVHYILYAKVVILGDGWDVPRYFARNLTLYKLPKFFTLDEWLRGEVEREAKTVREQVLTIDND